MSGILASKAVAVMIAEENVWKRIFGLDAQTLFDTCIVLIAMLVLFVFMSYLLFNPARDLINKRKELIAKDMESAKKDKEEAGKYKEEYDNKLKNVKAETDEIMSAARVKAKKQEAQIVDEAKEEAARIIKRAENEAVLEKGKAKDEMKQEIIAVASLMAEKIVESSMTEEEQNKIDEWKKEIKEQDEGLKVVGQYVNELKGEVANASEAIDGVHKKVKKVDKHTDKITISVESQNKKLKDLLEKIRGSDKICVDILLFLVLLGLAAVLYSILKNKFF